MPKVIRSSERRIIAHIYNYLERRKAEGHQYILLNNIGKLVSEMTGKPKVVLQLFTLKNLLFIPLQKKNKPKSKKKIDLDDFDLCAIRHKIHEFYAVRKEVPTLRKLLNALKESIAFPGGRESLRLILHKIRFKYMKCRNERQVLQERFDIVVWRERYLDEIKTIREQNIPIVYLDESYIHTKHNQNMCWRSELEPGILKSVAQGERYVIVHAGGSTGFVPNALLIYNDKEKKSDFHEAMNRANFKKWVLQKLIPNLNGPTCIVMDNAKYHTIQINKAPNSNYNKQKIMDWLTQNNIAFDENSSKSKLLILVKQNKPEPVYEIDTILSQNGHKVLRLPPYHCDLNPIEMVWRIVKGKIASKNINLNKNDFLQLVSDCFQEVTPDVWGNCCRHVENIENNFRNSCPIVEKEIDKFIIHGSDDNSTSDESSISNDDSETIGNYSSSSDDQSHTVLKDDADFEDIEYLESDFDYDE